VSSFSAPTSHVDKTYSLIKRWLLSYVAIGKVSLDYDDNGQSNWALAVYVNSLPSAELVVSVNKDDFLNAIKSLVPSVSASELKHYESLGRAFDDTRAADLS
jgi:hypothetical protein